MPVEEKRVVGFPRVVQLRPLRLRDRIGCTGLQRSLRRYIEDGAQHRSSKASRVWWAGPVRELETEQAQPFPYDDFGVCLGPRF